MKSQKQDKNNRSSAQLPANKEVSRKSSKALNDFLTASKKKSSPKTVRAKGLEISDLAPNDMQIGFYHPNIPLGTQAKAEKPANSNSESGVNECSAVSNHRKSKQRAQYAKDKYCLKNKSGISGSDRQSVLNGSQAGDEAEKVEESLRDFIGKIIGYYEKLNMGNSLLGKYENKISMAETLLEVFDLMKEMFEELMQNVLRESRGLLDCSDVSQADLKRDETDQLIHSLEKEIRVMLVREKELVKLSGTLEKASRAREAEYEGLKKKNDEVGARG